MTPPSSYISPPNAGELTEWPNVLAWKASVPQGTGGSNPSLSAIFPCPDLFPNTTTALEPSGPRMRPRMRWSRNAPKGPQIQGDCTDSVAPSSTSSLNRGRAGCRQGTASWRDVPPFVPAAYSKPRRPSKQHSAPPRLCARFLSLPSGLTPSTQKSRSATHPGRSEKSRFRLGALIYSVKSMRPYTPDGSKKPRSSRPSPDCKP